MINPLLTPFTLPPFSAIRPEDIVPAIKSKVADCRALVEHIAAQRTPFTWENLCQPLSESEDQLSRVWSPVEHLNSVKNSSELRVAYEEALLILSRYSTWIGHHLGLYQAYLNLKKGIGFSQLSIAQRRSVENTLRNFKLSGIGLAEDQQKRYGEIVTQLSELSCTYSNNVFDATRGWSKLIDHETQLSGVPSTVLKQTQEIAEAKEQKGWLLTLDMPNYLSILTYADNRDLREEMYRAFITRASDQGPHAGKWDNSRVMENTLALRHELAQLLGFSTYADKSLDIKMARRPQVVINFLHDLAKRARPSAEKELSQLHAFAKKHHGVDELQPWDITYYSEKQKQHLFTVSEEQFRPYFPEKKVLEGLFEILKRIYSITTKERIGVDTWNPEVRFFDLFDSSGELCGSLYLDLYTRENKRGGAWMGDCSENLRKSDGTLQKPIAYITCNFSRPLGDQPSLFTHNEVATLFHEFGHGLHHILTKIDVCGVSGINGVPWDAVELPSQLMENWCWEPEALALISGHYQSGLPIPKEMLDKLLKAKRYQGGLLILRQLELGLFDLLIHLQYNAERGAQILPTLAEVKQKISVMPSPDWGRFPHAFSHIFAGGYAAGYYSYLWAEVLSSDAYARFEEEGIFNAETGQSFLDNILSRGGSEDPMILFKCFRGREPQLDAMLRHYGIAE